MSSKSKGQDLSEQTQLQKRNIRFVTTSANFDLASYDNYEYPVGVSDTVPDQIIDLRLMLNRRASGMPVPTHEASYSNEEYPDFFKMDEFELAEYRLNLAEDMQKMSEQLHIASKELEKKQDEHSKNPVTQTDSNVKAESKKQESDDSKP